MFEQSIFQAAVAIIGSVASAGLALAYFTKVRIDRPSIGTFNGRDITVVFVFIVALPVLYLALPAWALTGFLALTFVSALFIPYRAVVARHWLALGIAGAICANIGITFGLLGTQGGWQLYWAVNSVMVILAAAGVANLYVQGGMRLRHVVWLAAALGVYDIIFSQVIPLTPLLADTFEGRPLDPAVGFILGGYQANIGLGDLLVYSLFTIAAFRGYGRRGAALALGGIVIFGALVPALAPLALSQFTRAGIGIVVPAQTFFGPAAVFIYRRLTRRASERTPAQWLAPAGPVPAPVLAEAR